MDSKVKWRADFWIKGPEIQSCSTGSFVSGPHWKEWDISSYRPGCAAGVSDPEVVGTVWYPFRAIAGLSLPSNPRDSYFEDQGSNLLGKEAPVYVYWATDLRLWRTPFLLGQVPWYTSDLASVPLLKWSSVQYYLDYTCVSLYNQFPLALFQPMLQQTEWALVGMAYIIILH